MVYFISDTNIFTFTGESIGELPKKLINGIKIANGNLYIKFNSLCVCVCVCVTLSASSFGL